MEAPTPKMQSQWQTLSWKSCLAPDSRDIERKVLILPGPMFEANVGLMSKLVDDLICHGYKDYPCVVDWSGEDVCRRSEE